MAKSVAALRRAIGQLCTTEGPDENVIREARRRLLLIHNPTAGVTRKRHLQTILRLLQDAGCTVDLRSTSGPGDATRLAAMANADAVDLVVAAGGDGTINEIVNGLGANPPPLGILPLGTANVVAGEIGLRTDPHSVVRTLLFGPPQKIALGQINGRRFIATAGAGFDAHVVRKIPQALKRRLGKTAYFLTAVYQIGAFSYPRYRVTIDGTVHDAASVVVANGRFYAGHHQIAPEGRLEAPRLEVCLFERTGPLGVVVCGTALLLDQLHQTIRRIPAKRLTIEGPGADPVQGDGDIIAELDAEIEAIGDALTVITPRAAERTSKAAADDAARPVGRPRPTQAAARELAPDAGD